MNINNKFLSILVLFMINMNIFAATLSAQVDLNPVLLSDSFHLTYKVEGSVDDEPNFSIIKNNFYIINSGKSSNISIINGSYTRTEKWTLTLRAKQAGVFRIPPISFGKDNSPEVEITVKKSLPNTSSTVSKDFILELDATKQNSYIQEQIIITLRLLVSKSINSYQFGEINIDNTNTMIEALGKDSQYKTYRGSTQYIVIEKKIAIFPQQAGELIIQPSIAEIGITHQQSHSNFFDPFNSNTQVRRLQSNTLKLKIKDKPSVFQNNDWLASPSVKLTEDWPSNTEFKVGDPITRTITLTADNLTAAQLPEFEALTVDNLKQYPDKPSLKNNKTSTGINASRKEKIAIIPTKPGTYILPSIDIAWWNTQENKLATAHISKREFTVVAAAKTNEQQTNISSTRRIQNISTGEPPRTSSDINVSTGTEKWFWFALIFLVLWIITLFLWWRTLHSNKKTQTSSIEKTTALNTHLKFIKHACSKNNHQELKSTLLDWAKVVFSDQRITNLSHIAEKVDEPLRSKLVKLNSQLYSATKSSWQCHGIDELCRKYKIPSVKNKTKSDRAILEPFKRTS